MVGASKSVGAIQLFSKMFGIGKHSRDIITLFHKPSSKASIRVLNLLKQTAATAQTTATIDQAASHESQNAIQRSDFDLEVTETSPTGDQLRTILEYTRGKKVDSYVTGATSVSDAMAKIKESADAFRRPVVVDWTNGIAVAGEDETEIVNLVRGNNPKEP